MCYDIPMNGGGCMIDIKENFACNLKRIRLEKGLTQKRLCELSGVPLRTIQDLEAGKNSATISTAIPLAQALETSVECMGLTRCSMSKD